MIKKRSLLWLNKLCGFSGVYIRHQDETLAQYTKRLGIGLDSWVTVAYKPPVASWQHAEWDTYILSQYGIVFLCNTPPPTFFADNVHDGNFQVWKYIPGETQNAHKVETREYNKRRHPSHANKSAEEILSEYVEQGYWLHYSRDKKVIEVINFDKEVMQVPLSGLKQFLVV